MSDIDDAQGRGNNPIGHLSGKTTTYKVRVKIEDPKIERTDYFAIYGQPEEEGGKKPYYILNIVDMWTEKQGMMAKLQVLGDRPKRPFDVGADVYLATEEQIATLLGINNPPEISVALGKLLGYPFKVNLAVKNFGRIFITGKSGSGKSYTMGVLCEEFLKKGIPVVIIDRHGEYGSLKVAADDDDTPAKSEIDIIPQDTLTGESSKTESIKAKSKDEGPGESQYVDNIIEFADLNKNKGGDIDLDYLFSLDATDIVAQRLCTIVNLRGLDLEVQEIITGKLLKKLYEASTSRKIPPFYLFLDEAHLFAGKKQTETCDIVKLFAQEGRKFGANIVIGTQRPQLLDTTIRAQAGTWIVMNLSDVRDISITIQSAEDLSNENKDDISGLDKGEGIICGEAVAGIPLFVKVRKRTTKHGGIGFNPLDFLSEQTVEELQKRKHRILGEKSEEELEAGKEEFQVLTSAKSSQSYLEENTKLKARIKELEEENEILRQGMPAGEEIVGAIPSGSEGEKIKELTMEVKVWKEKYNALKSRKEAEQVIAPIPEIQEIPLTDNSELVLELENTISMLESEVKKYKKKHEDGIRLAEKLMEELKKKK
ncbi:MAG: helicase HerA domain-containing protein [Promethearchaeota archaeon]